jgi:hypothetical protein
MVVRSGFGRLDAIRGSKTAHLTAFRRKFYHFWQRLENLGRNHSSENDHMTWVSASKRAVGGREVGKMHGSRDESKSVSEGSRGRSL